MCERAEDLGQALGEVIAGLDGVDPAQLSDPEVHELVVRLQREESCFAAVRARLLAAWDARRTWADDGSKAAAARLARECRLSGRTARGELKRARKLATMSHTAAALAAGRISADQADLLAYANQPAVAHLFDRDEQMLLDNVATLRFFEALRFVKYWLQAAHDEMDQPPSTCRHHDRHFAAVRTLYDRVDLRGSLDVMGGTEFLSELGRLEQELFEADWAQARAANGRHALPEQLARSAPQRRADALVEMARRSRALPEGARPARPLITVLTGFGAFAKVCELADGTVLAPGEVVPLLSRAVIERIVFDGPSRVIDVGRQRLFTGALRRAIEVRDRYCQHPSECDVPYDRCHIDHIVPYGEGGLTTQDNGRCYCPVHNRQRVGEEHARPPPDGDDHD